METQKPNNKVYVIFIRLDQLTACDGVFAHRFS
jgi:hypothetical protein